MPQLAGLSPQKNTVFRKRANNYSALSHTTYWHISLYLRINACKEFIRAYIYIYFFYSHLYMTSCIHTCIYVFYEAFVSVRHLARRIRSLANNIADERTLSGDLAHSDEHVWCSVCCGVRGGV